MTKIKPYISYFEIAKEKGFRGFSPRSKTFSIAISSHKDYLNASKEIKHLQKSFSEKLYIKKQNNKYLIIYYKNLKRY